MEIMPWRSRQSSPISSLQSEMNRMLEDFFTQPFGLPVVRGNGHGAVVVPALDVKEDEQSLVVSAELPGIRREDVEISVHDDMLEIRGQKSEEQKRDQENFHLVERSFGSFARRIRLPAEVDSEHAEASMDNGVLTLRLPKAEPRHGKKTIEIKSGQMSSQSQMGSQSSQGQMGSQSSQGQMSSQSSEGTSSQASSQASQRS